MFRIIDLCVIRQIPTKQTSKMDLKIRQSLLRTKTICARSCSGVRSNAQNQSKPASILRNQNQMPNLRGQTRHLRPTLLTIRLGKGELPKLKNRLPISEYQRPTVLLILRPNKHTMSGHPRCRGRKLRPASRILDVGLIAYLDR